MTVSILVIFILLVSADYTYSSVIVILPAFQNRTCTTLNIINDNIKETREKLFMFIYRVIPLNNKFDVDYTSSTVWIQDDD